MSRSVAGPDQSRRASVEARYQIDPSPTPILGYSACPAEGMPHHTDRRQAALYHGKTSLIVAALQDLATTIVATVGTDMIGLHEFATLLTLQKRRHGCCRKAIGPPPVAPATGSSSLRYCWHLGTFSLAYNGCAQHLSGHSAEFIIQKSGPLSNLFFRKRGLALHL